jgi:uncharacterized Zn-finger protein
VQTVTDVVVPHFHNEPGVAVIEIGAKTFMCIGALPPQDHPHVFCDMGNDLEYVCPYCSTLYRHNPELGAQRSAPSGMRVAPLRLTTAAEGIGFGSPLALYQRID